MTEVLGIDQKPASLKSDDDDDKDSLLQNKK